MTASRNKASRAVTAALVGVLSVGAVPMVAVAATSDSGASLLTAGTAEDIAGGQITSYVDQDGNECGTEFVYEEVTAQYIVPVEVTTKLGSVLDVEDNDLSVYYYKASDSESSDIYLVDDDGEYVYVEAISKEDITDRGTYYVGVGTAGEDNAANLVWLEFKIVGKSLEDAYVTGETQQDTTLYYTGANQSIYSGDVNVYVGNTELVPGTDYTFSLYKAGGTTDGVYLNEAGDYVLRLTGINDYEGSVVEIPVTVNPLDLSTADIELSSDTYATTGTALPTYVSSVNGLAITKGVLGDAKIELTYVSSSNGSSAPNASLKGTYTYRVSVGNDSTNVVNSQEITVVRYDKNATFQYDGGNWPSDNLDEFDASKVSVKGGDEDLDYEVSYEKLVDGVWVDVTEDEAALPGTYRATVTVSDDTYEYGGSQTVQFSVAATSVSTSDIYVLYDGELVDGSASDIYSGEDFLDRFSVRAFDADGKEVDSDEFEIVVTDEDGNEVDSIVDAGTYTVSVETKDGSMYAVDGEDDSVTFTVNQVNTVETDSGYNAELRLTGTRGYADEDGNTYVYTGEAVTPAFEYDLIGDGYESEEWLTLPDTAYTATYEVQTDEENDEWEAVDECVEPGTYRVTIVSADDNYKISNTVTFVISDAKVFADVSDGDWYADVVYEAATLGYMSGYGNGTFFGPTDSICRADAVMVIWRMAGQPDLSDANVDEGSTSNTEFDLPYEDVDESAYYAKALYWATKVGIVSGDAGSYETFRPSDSVTREEFAKMLYVYEQLQGNVTEDVDEDEILSAYSDADSVSEWAEEYVAWLVDQGVMGVDTETINGGGNIVRAEVAAMAVRIQPGGPLKDFLGL